MRHQDLQLNHRLESYVYANAAARTGASGFVSGDVGRIAYQTDTGQYWRLTATTPAWQIIASPAYDTFQGSATNPTGTATVFPGVMMGLPGTITPSGSGKVIFTLSASGSSTVIDGAGQVQMRFGTATKPANGAAVTGTAVGTLVQFTVPAASDLVAVSSSTIILGMTIGTVYWLDVSLNTSGAAGTASLKNAVLLAAEIP